MDSSSLTNTTPAALQSKYGGHGTRSTLDNGQEDRRTWRETLEAVLQLRQQTNTKKEEATVTVVSTYMHTKSTHVLRNVFFGETN
jgi:hypothetical protein